MNHIKLLLNIHMSPVSYIQQNRVCFTSQNQAIVLYV